jgi:predicted ATPase/Tfp pilus assembly protein PilF
MGLHHFRDLNQPEQVFQVVAPDLPSEFAPLKSVELALDNLLVQPYSGSQLIGREQELATLSEWLSQEGVRLVTLTGVGGTGKTRLSLAVARLIRSQFEQGVSFIPLEIVTLRQTLIKEIATTLKVKEIAGEPLLDTLKAYLADKQLLLVLDNFEQLVAQGATLLPELLHAAPKLKILVTSREVLQLSQEHEYPVEPLALPQLNVTNATKLPVQLTPSSLAGYAAISLFVARAQMVKPDFKLSEENASSIAQVCQKLDGLPLAIELAAALIKLLSPARLLERLRASDKLKVLTGGARDLPARQQTLRGAIDWSYNLLDPTEQYLFRCLAIFAGGCTVESAEAVCELDGLDILEGLAALSNKSLLKQRQDQNGEVRFTMLPTIREYGLEKLTGAITPTQSTELAVVELAYIKYFVQWATASEDRLLGSDQLGELARLDSEYDNLREVLERSMKSSFPLPPHYALQLSGILERFWNIRGYFSEGRSYLQRSLALPTTWHNDDPKTQESNKAARIKALLASSSLAAAQGDYPQAQAYAQESLALSHDMTDTHNIATSLNSLGVVAFAQGDYTHAQEYYSESLKLRQQLGNKWEIGISLNNLGGLVLIQKDYKQAQAYYQESLNIAQQIGNKSSIAFALGNLGNISVEQADFAQAQAYFEESLVLWRELGNRRWLAITLSNFGNLMTRLGHHLQALGYVEEGLHLQKAVGDKWGISYSLVGFMLLATQRELQPTDDAKSKNLLAWLASLSGALDTLLNAIELELQPTEATYYQAAMEIARTGLGETEFKAAFAKGQTMSLEVAVDFALTIRPLLFPDID